MAEITVDNISKRYGGVEALRGVSFEVERGTLFGIIGPDGAGKTTLFRILTTLLVPDGGTATVSGCDVVRDYKQIRRSVGYMPGKFSLYPDLTVEENLSFFASVFNTTIRENYRLVEDIYCQIEPFKNRRAGKLSGGMKQKLALCCALIHSPRVLFLDEPTTGVDPVSRKELWVMLHRLIERGITIVVSTPYMDEAGQCDTMALINDGRFMTIDTPQRIIDGYERELYSITLSDKIAALDSLNAIRGIDNAYAFGRDIHIVTEADALSLKNMLHVAGHDTSTLTMVQPTIEDCFIELNRKS